MIFLQYYEEIRLNELLLAVNLIGMARMHIGASETEDLRIPFDKYYNSEAKVDKHGYRSKSFIYEKGFEEIEEAKAHFRKACRSCPFRETCGQDVPNVKKYREELFYKLLSDSKLRTRYRDRVKRFVDRKNFLERHTCQELIETKIIR